MSALADCCLLAVWCGGGAAIVLELAVLLECCDVTVILLFITGCSTHSFATCLLLDCGSPDRQRLTLLGLYLHCAHSCLPLRVRCGHCGHSPAWRTSRLWLPLVLPLALLLLLLPLLFPDRLLLLWLAVLLPRAGCGRTTRWISLSMPSAISIF